MQQCVAKRERREWLNDFYNRGTSRTEQIRFECDKEFAFICDGEFDWERSWIVYNKDFIQDEIVEIMKNLYDPNKSLSRRQLLKNFVPFSRY